MADTEGAVSLKVLAERKVEGRVKPTAEEAEMEKKLFEIRASVEYAVVIAAETKEQALKHVETWEHAWDSTADLLGVSIELADTRDPVSDETIEDEAHEVV